VDLTFESNGESAGDVSTKVNYNMLVSYFKQSDLALSILKGTPILEKPNTDRLKAY
jgi:hypothetical protein